jgi:gluconolactonase
MRTLFVVSVLLLAGCAEKQPAAAVVPDEPQVAVAASVAFTEGPAQGPDGMMYFTDVANNRILRLNPATKKHEVYRADSNRANGLLFDAQGRLIACEGSDGERNQPRVTRTDLKTGKVEELATKYEGQVFNAPNDVTIDSKGR